MQFHSWLLQECKDGLLSAHNYVVQYRKALRHANADGLSRLPLPVQPKKNVDTIDVFYLKQFEPQPVSTANDHREIKVDPTLSVVFDLVMRGNGTSELNQNHEFAPFLTKLK